MPAKFRREWKEYFIKMGQDQTDPKQTSWLSSKRNAQT